LRYQEGGLVRHRKKYPLLLCCAVFLVARVACAQESSDEPPAPPKNAVVEQLHVVYHYENNGTGAITHTVRLRILTEVGLKVYGAVYVPYSSQLEDLRIDYLRTIKADGTTIPADPSKAMDVTPPVARFAPMFSDVKIKVLVAQQVQVGDEIEYQYTRTVRVPYMPGNFWVMYSLDRANPITSASVVLDVPAGRKLAFKSDPCFPYTVTKKGGRKFYQWQISHLDPPKVLRAYRSPLFAVSTLSDWKQVGEWYAALQSGGTRVTPQIQALANKLTAGKTTPEQKLDAIYAYVSERIRYVALEFGIGGFQAHAAGVVEANGYGDCKDKAGLLQALLAAAGIKAYPALVNALVDKVETAVPMPSQFDHVITVVPLNGKTLWLDSTLETAPAGVMSPAVAGKQALLIEPGASGLVAVPVAPATTPVSIATATGSLDAAGKLTLKDSMLAEGIAGVIMRQVFRLQDKKQLENIVKRMSQMQVVGASASDWSSSDPDDLSVPFKYQYTLTRPAFIDLLETRQEIAIPHVLIDAGQWGGLIATAREESKQKSSGGCAGGAPEEIKLYGPYEHQETLNLSTPANYHVDLAEPIAVTRAFGSYTSSYNFNHGRLTVHRDLKINAASIPLAQLDALENFQDLVNADLNQKLTLRRAGNAAALADASSMTARQLIVAALEALDPHHHDPVLGRDLLLKAVAKDAKSQYAWNSLGHAYALIGNYYQAEKAYRKQLTINPYDSYAYNNLGRLEAAEQHDGRAIADYKQQVSVSPLDPYATANLAAAYTRQRDWNDAASAYANAVRIAPNNPLLVVAWGTALLRAGKTDEGRRVIARVLEISKQPVVLNNIAYGMAQAGVDLPKAEEYARSAVDQVIPASATSLDVPKNYDASLSSLSSFLDTLGFALYKEGRLAEAGPYLQAAFEIRHDPTVSQHLAMLAMKQDHAAAALRYYSYAVAEFEEQHPHISKELDAYLRGHGGLPDMTAARVAEVQKEEEGLDLLARRPGGHLTFPQTSGTAPAWVALNVQVSTDGSVGDAKVFRGKEPYASAALHDVRQLRFQPLAWANHSLATVRTVYFLYDPGAANAGDKVMAIGHPGKLSEPTDTSLESNFNLGLASSAAVSFLIQGHVQAGVQCLAEQANNDVTELYARMVMIGRQLRYAGDLDAASAVLRKADSLQPKDDFAYRELGETLKAAGDRAGAIQAYQQLLTLDPDDARSHYSLGAEYEAGADQSAGAAPAARKSRKQAAIAFQPALDQYAQAAKLDRANATYRNAFQALYQKVYQRPPPANPAGASTNP
jgi:tetratricopeptide (TPR) repeat protein